MSNDYDVHEKVEQTRHGYKLTMESTRGTGTRDQNSVSIQGREESLDDLLDNRAAMRSAVIEEMDELRAHQPDEKEEE